MENDVKDFKELAQEIAWKADCLTDLAFLLADYVEDKIELSGCFTVLAAGLRDLRNRADALNKELL